MSARTLRVSYNADYVAAAYEFDTTRKAKWIHDRVAAEPIPGLEFADPSPWYNLAVEGILAVHDPRYVEAVRTGEPLDLAESQGFDWDPGIYRGAVASTAGVLAAIDAAMSGQFGGSLSSGLHHARRDHGNGFCTFNGLAVGAWYLREHARVRNVTILDLDAHAGGGTVSLIDPEVTHLDLTVSPFDTYEVGGTRNIVMARPTDDGYLSEVEGLLGDIPPETFVLYNAGMDPAGLVSPEALAYREAMVALHMLRSGLRGAFVLAGGYTWAQSRAALVEAHMVTLRTFAEAARIGAVSLPT